MPSVTIRDVPDDTHAELSARAALQGLSLQEYLRGQLIALAQKPDATTLLMRVRERKHSAGSRLPARRILKYRDTGRG
jgi:hypothetical protein